MELEDRVFLVNPIGDTVKIWVVHQAAQRLHRKDIVQTLKKNFKELETFDLEDMYQLVEAHAVDVENKLLKMVSEQSESQVPVFDFEIN